jgi:ATP-dependent exoDNAse (exonuclease V) beta subunit
VRKEAPELFEIVTKLLPHAKSIQVKILIDQTTATRDLLKLVAEKLDNLMVRERKFRYEDVTRKVGEYRFSDERLQSLNHRLNGNTKHLLLDEFQDTSIPQWNILRPLAEKVAQDKLGTFFCVGDVKQSIYSWRGGVAAVFDTMKQSIENSGAAVAEASMDTTRRCCSQVVETVNTVFQNIKDNEAVQVASPKAGAEWQKRFQQHEPHGKDVGYCSLEESPRVEDGEEKGEVHLQYVVNRIVELARILENRPKLKHGIGILVSTGKFEQFFEPEKFMRIAEGCQNSCIFFDRFAVALHCQVAADIK